MPRPLLPVGAQRLARHRADATYVAVGSHGQYVLTVTAAPASRVKAAVRKEAW